MNPHFYPLLLAVTTNLSAALPVYAAEELPIKALIVDGRNNHDWEITTDALRAILEATGRFEVSVSTAPELKSVRNPRRPKTEDPTILADFDRYEKAFKTQIQPAKEKLAEQWESWAPDFSSHDVIILNYNGENWPESMRQSFIDYVQNGGSVLLVHAANNAFRDWEEYNQVIGMGWRPAPSGKALKIDPETGRTIWDKTAGNSSHGSKHPFQIAVRATDHPVMRDLPPVWMHGKDELYHDMRGPAENLTILSSAFSDPEQRGSGKHEPITWEVVYGKGKAVVTSMGHFWKGDTSADGLHCVGFQTVFARSCEYLATGKVTLPIPDTFPSAEESIPRTPALVDWKSKDNITDSEAAQRAKEKKKQDPYGPLTPDEELTTFDLAPGYVAELVASGPAVQEPVLTVFDGNGVMYVAEMRSYMQDVEGTGTKTLKNGRIKRLEDTNGDGNFDRVTTFVDDLNLPRMILPLDDRIAVRETDTMDIVYYRDTDDDGIADEKEMLYERGPYGRGNIGTSVEHQDSGLLWNLDNHIYITYNIERYRFTDGDWKAKKQHGHWTQWGLANNDVGDLFWITNTNPMESPYLHPKYWDTVKRLAGKEIRGVPIDMGKPYDPGFLSVKSLCLLNDRGGPAAEVRSFTSACGQTVYRGHKFPLEDYGDYFLCDPTIHVVRRANMSKKSGLDFLEKTEPGDSEFLRSSDINSRFINTATGPDGCLYVTDMYRGIIQDAGWLSPEPRENIKANGLDKNKQMGRIWRIRHQDHAPEAAPKMLEESTVELLRHLEHPSGWWRDTAQKLIILREDRDTVVPLLKGMSQYSDNALTRLHALWTLEGTDSLAPDFVVARFSDHDPRVRRAAVQIADRWINSDDFVKHFDTLRNEKDGTVAQQLILTLGLAVENPLADDYIQQVARRHLNDSGVILATGISLWGKTDLPFVKAIENGKEIDVATAAPWKAAFTNWNRGLNFPDGMDKDHKRLVSEGEVHYYQSCVVCHGADGQGIKTPGTESYLAPSLADSPRIKGDAEQLVPILLHGLMGPLDGKTYQAGFMAPAAALGLTREREIAQVLSFIRYAWDGNGSAVTEDEVKAIKAATAERKAPWTQKELEAE